MKPLSFLLVLVFLMYDHKKKVRLLKNTTATALRRYHAIMLLQALI
jgi:hypothetical protein